LQVLHSIFLEVSFDDGPLLDGLVDHAPEVVVLLAAQILFLKDAPDIIILLVFHLHRVNFYGLLLGYSQQGRRFLLFLLLLGLLFLERLLIKFIIAGHAPFHHLAEVLH
jgi:hypothetical protein